MSDKNMSDIKMKECPFCSEEIKDSASKCKHCGEILDPKLIKTQKEDVQMIKTWNPLLAGILSFLFPGLGQLYKGQVASWILWFIFIIIGYFLFFIPWLILHLICIITAITNNP